MSYRWFSTIEKGEFVRDARTSVNQGMKWLDGKLFNRSHPISLGEIVFQLCEVKMFWSPTLKNLTKDEIVEMLRDIGCVHVKVIYVGSNADNKGFSEWLEFENKEKHDSDEEWMSTALQKQIDDHVRKTGQENACIWRGDGKKHTPSPEALAEGIATRKAIEAEKRKAQAERRKQARLKQKAQQKAVA